MPLYEFRLEDGTNLDLVFSSSEVPKIGEIIILDDGRKAMRLASLPQVNADPLNPFSQESALRKFEKEEKTIGDTVDNAKKLSAERAAKSYDGIDPERKKFFTDYKERRNGQKHPKDNIT